MTFYTKLTDPIVLDPENSGTYIKLKHANRTMSTPCMNPHEGESAYDLLVDLR